MKSDLLASSGTMAGIINILKEYYFSRSIELKSVSVNEWQVLNSKGVIPSVRVIRHNNRYRFERMA